MYNFLNRNKNDKAIKEKWKIIHPQHSRATHVWFKLDPVDIPSATDHFTQIKSEPKTTKETFFNNWIIYNLIVALQKITLMCVCICSKYKQKRKSHSCRSTQFKAQSIQQQDNSLITHVHFTPLKKSKECKTLVTSDWFFLLTHSKKIKSLKQSLK